MDNLVIFNERITEAGGSTTLGGEEVERLVLAGLTQLDDHGVRLPQLAEITPTLENGLWKLFPDGRMETTWKLRAQARWHDGAPFTAADRLYEATKDGFRRYPYDPERAKVILRDLGWAPGPDGVLGNAADGRRFRTQVSNTAGSNDWETPVYADYWRRIGLEVEEITIPAALQQNREFRALYPGWEASSGVQGDDVLNRLKGPPASAENRWAANRGGYEDPTADALLIRYYASIADRDQLAAMRAINEFFVETLPFLPMYFSTDHVGRRKGIVAFDDVQGGLSGGNKYGTYTRNAHLWDLE